MQLLRWMSHGYRMRIEYRKDMKSLRQCVALLFYRKITKGDFMNAVITRRLSGTHERDSG